MFAPSLTPEQTKKLIDKRNARFVEAVNEWVLPLGLVPRCDTTNVCRLIEAAPDGEDPVQLLRSAARDHVPVDPRMPQPDAGPSTIPAPETRPAISDILDELIQADWYSDQIVSRRVVEPREASVGDSDLSAQ